MDIIDIIKVWVWFVVALVTFFVLAINRSKKNKQIVKDNDEWATRSRQVRAKAARYEKDLEVAQIETGLKIATKGYYHSDTPIELFNLNVDHKNKKIALCSFEETPYKFYILDFANIKSFKILDNQSFQADGLYGDLESRNENIRLKIETYDVYSVGIQVCLCLFRMDVSSSMYNDLLRDIDDIKMILNRILEENEKTNKNTY